MFRVLNPNGPRELSNLSLSFLFLSRASLPSERDSLKDFIHRSGKILRFKKNNRGGDSENIESSVVQNNSSSSSSFGTGGGGGGKERKKMMTTISSSRDDDDDEMWKRRLYCRILLSTSNGEETLERVFEKEEASFFLL